MIIILMTILRLLHILLGVVWMGFGSLSAWVLHPTADRLGTQGDTMLRTFYLHSRFKSVMPIAAIGTTLAGLILWPFRTVQGNLLNLITFSTTGDVVMVVGAVFGLLAFGHGAGATGRFIGVFTGAAKQYEDAPKDENERAMQAAKEKLYTHANISAWLTLVAVVCMSGARYL